MGRRKKRDVVSRETTDTKMHTLPPHHPAVYLDFAQCTHREAVQSHRVEVPSVLAAELPSPAAYETKPSVQTIETTASPVQVRLNDCEAERLVRPLFRLCLSPFPFRKLFSFFFHFPRNVSASASQHRIKKTEADNYSRDFSTPNFGTRISPTLKVKVETSDDV
jgi:hypothetical protein